MDLDELVDMAIFRYLPLRLSCITSKKKVFWPARSLRVRRVTDGSEGGMVVVDVGARLPAASEASSLRMSTKRGTKFPGTSILLA